MEGLCCAAAVFGVDGHDGVTVMVYMRMRIFTGPKANEQLEVERDKTAALQEVRLEPRKRDMTSYACNL